MTKKIFVIAVFLISQILVPMIGTDVSLAAKPNRKKCLANASKARKIANAACKAGPKKQRIRCENKAFKAYSIAVRKCPR